MHTSFIHINLSYFENYFQWKIMWWIQMAHIPQGWRSKFSYLRVLYAWVFTKPIITFSLSPPFFYSHCFWRCQAHLWFLQYFWNVCFRWELLFDRVLISLAWWQYSNLKQPKISFVISKKEQSPLALYYLPVYQNNSLYCMKEYVRIHNMKYTSLRKDFDFILHIE